MVTKLVLSQILNYFLFSASSPMQLFAVATLSFMRSGWESTVTLNIHNKLGYFKILCYALRRFGRFFRIILFLSFKNRSLSCRCRHKRQFLGMLFLVLSVACLLGAKRISTIRFCWSTFYEP